MNPVLVPVPCWMTSPGATPHAPDMGNPIAGWAQRYMRGIPVCRLAESLTGVGIGTSAENFAGLAAVEIASVLKASRHFITPMRQLNQFGADGKLPSNVPPRPRALRITVRGPDHFSGGRAASGKQRNFRSFQRQLQKQNPALGRAGGGYGLAILLNSRISASSRFSSMFRARSCWSTPPL